jgi:hypothetical protein
MRDERSQKWSRRGAYFSQAWPAAVIIAHGLHDIALPTIAGDSLWASPPGDFAEHWAEMRRRIQEAEPDDGLDPLAAGFEIRPPPPGGTSPSWRRVPVEPGTSLRTNSRITNQETAPPLAPLDGTNGKGESQ